MKSEQSLNTNERADEPPRHVHLEELRIAFAMQSMRGPSAPLELIQAAEEAARTQKLWPSWRKA